MFLVGQHLHLVQTEDTDNQWTSIMKLPLMAIELEEDMHVA